MRRLLVASLLLCASTASADVDPKFAALRDAAEPVGGLAGFLERYIGECADPFGKAECRERAKAFREKVAGKKLYMVVSEDASQMLSAGEYDMPGGEYIVNVVPFFSAAGLGLSHGAPKGLDANGNPILPLQRIKGYATDQMDPMRFSRLFAQRVLRVQVVFTPEGVWSLAKGGGRKIHGVKAKINALLITHSRTGEQIALWINK